MRLCHPYIESLLTIYQNIKCLYINISVPDVRLGGLAPARPTNRVFCVHEIQMSVEHRMSVYPNVHHNVKIIHHLSLLLLTVARDILTAFPDCAWSLALI